ncbi:DEKNAAC104322 [Brettanomyces naardenensis]|uniref:DEKNAAC104322 n=1 Tax=Brettanomyces naardenensis TaxID=13370 RepID=A0A448YQP3_BRENA|nr:DEKNAAC104322 [Brettanomyces naardenensis]
MTPRTFLACDLCRRSKIKCINSGDSQKPCQRCAKHTFSCTYTPTSSQIRKRQNKRKRLRQRTFKHIQASLSPPDDNCPIVLPEKALWYEIADVFFKNQYQGIFPFIHKPSFYAFLRSSEFNPATYFIDYYKRKDDDDVSILKWPDPLVLLGILALCARLHPTLVRRYGDFNEESNPQFYQPNLAARDNENEDHKTYPHSASKYFGWHARMMLRSVFDRPTVQRVQALTMLSSHEWGEKNIARSFSYIGIGARMSLLLGLGEPNSMCYENEKLKGNDQKSAFIMQEVKRRTLWSVYMMDRCISSGRNRSSAIRVDDIKIQLPCTERDFAFGTNVKCMTFNELMAVVEKGEPDDRLPKTTSTTFTVAAFEVWAKIAKWAGEGGARNEKIDPWLEGSTYHELSGQVSRLEKMLPSHLQYNSINLDAHIAANSAGFFGYLHCLLFLCRIFTTREYLYNMTSESLKKGWWEECIQKLVDAVKRSSTLINALSSLNLMVVAPFTGFEIFTNAGTSLYLSSFPAEVLQANLKDSKCLQSDFKEISLQNGRLLRHWGDVWTLANCWDEWILEMRDSFSHLTVRVNQEGESSLRSILLDYGSPIIQDENDRSVKVEEPKISYKAISEVKETPIESTMSSIGYSPFGGDNFESFDIGSLFPGWYDAIHSDERY